MGKFSLTHKKKNPIFFMKTPQPSYLTLSCLLNADNRGKGEATFGRAQGDKYFSKYDDYC